MEPAETLHVAAVAAESKQGSGEAQRVGPTLVRVVDIDISIGTMVVLLLKAAVAVIPAAIVIGVVVLTLAVLVAGMFGATFAP